MLTYTVTAGVRETCWTISHKQWP